MDIFSETRNHYIDQLISDDVDTIQNSPIYYIESFLKYGHRGYMDYTDEELIRAYNERFADRR